MKEYSKNFNTCNLIIFIGLIISGGSMILMPLIPSLGRLLVVGVFTGYCFGFFAGIVFLISLILHLLGRLENFWLSYIPINFGLTGLGLAIVSWSPSKQLPFLAFFSSIIIALLISLTGIQKYRIFCLIPLVPIVILMQGYRTAYEWDILVGISFLYIFITVFSSFIDILKKKGKSNQTLQGTR